MTRNLRGLVLSLTILSAALAGLAEGQVPPPPTNSTDFVLEQIFVDAPVAGIRQTVVARVYNNGSEDATASVSFSWNSEGRPLQDGSTGVVTFPRSIAARERVNFEFDWTPGTEQAGDGRIVAEVRSSVASDWAPENNVRDVDVFVRHHEITLSFEELDPEAQTSRWVPEPDGEGHYQLVGYRFRIRNVGNTPDVANVSVAPVDEWYVRTPTRYFHLNASEHVDGFVLIRPPRGATNETDPRSAVLRASSLEFERFAAARDAAEPVAATLSTPPVSVWEAAETNFSVAASIPSRTVFVEPDGERAVTVSVTNSGSVWDAFNVTARLDGDAAPRFGILATDRDLNATSAQVYLAPGAKRDVRLVIRGDASLETPDRVVVKIDVQSVNSGAAVASGEFSARTSGSDLLILSASPSSTLYSGREGTLVVMGRNEGDKPVAQVPVVVRYLRDGTWMNVTDRPLTTTARGHSTWSVHAPIDTTGLAGRYRIDVRVDPSRTIDEYDVSNNFLTSEFVVRTVSLELTPPPPQVVVPGERLRLTEGGPAFYVRNSGSYDEEVDLRIVSENGLVNTSLKRLVPANQKVAVDFVLDVPERPLTTSDVLHATLTVPAEGRLRLDAQAALTIDDRSPPRLSVEPPASLVAGRAARIGVLIVDETPVTAAYLHVELSDGSTRVIPLEPMGGDRFEASFTPPAPGNLTLVVKAWDGALPPNENETLALGVPVAAPDTRPRIELERPSGNVPLGPGHVVRWSVSSDTPHVHVNYSLDGGPFIPIGAPYTLVTDAWTDGEHALAIRASDAYGNVGDDSFVLTRDTVAPTLDEIDFEVRSSGLVAVSVVGSPDALTASAVTLQDGRRFPLEGFGPFRGSVSASPGDSLRIVLTDRAGNAGTFDVVVPKAAAGLDAPGAFTAAVLIAAACVLRRRR